MEQSLIRFEWNVHPFQGYLLPWCYGGTERTAQWRRLGAETVHRRCKIAVHLGNLPAYCASEILVAEQEKIIEWGNLSGQRDDGT